MKRFIKWAYLKLRRRSYFKCALEHRLMAASNGFYRA
jgi:hypothetical protein